LGMFKAINALMATIAVALPLSTGAAQATPGWMLTQRSMSLGNQAVDQYVYVSPNGLKLNMPRQKINIVMSAPSWTVCFYNENTKNFYTTSFENWMLDINKRMGGKADLARGKWTKGPGGDVAGMKATQYTAGGATGTGKGANIRHADCWVSDQISVPPKISTMISRGYGLPDTPYFPLKVSYVLNNGSLNNVLDTYRTQQSDIPDNFFGLPQGYKQVASQAEVMMDDETQSILRDLVKD